LNYPRTTAFFNFTIRLLGILINDRSLLTSR
jgi:hypothetical protein